jgi:hypothetical protein
MNHTSRITRLLGAALLVGAVLTTREASAQSRLGQSPARPTISPYLNLLNENFGALNYYNQVRAQQSFRSFESQVNRQFGTVQQDLHQLERMQTQVEGSPPLGPTGHPTMFMNLGGYFGTQKRR